MFVPGRYASTAVAASDQARPRAMLLSFSHGDTGRRWSVLCGEMPARTMQKFTARSGWMLFVRLAAPGVVEPLHPRRSVQNRGIAPGPSRRPITQREGHHLGMRARAGRTRSRQLSTSQSRGHARLPRFHGCGVIACCVGRPGGPSRSRRGRLPAAAWALRVGRPAADRHLFGMAPSHGELLNLETADDVRPLPGDMHSQRRENQEPQPLANHHIYP